MITLEALCAALTRIACVGTQFFPSTGGLAEGYLALEPAPHRLFGTNPNGPQRA